MRTSISAAPNGQPGDLGEARHVDQVAAAQQHGELAQVELGAQHLRVAGQDVAQVGGERVEVGEVRLGDALAGRPESTDPGGDGTPGRSPPDDEQLGAVLLVELHAGDVGRDAVDLLLAEPHHVLVVVGLVADVAVAVVLLDAADAVLQPGGAGQRPRPGERLGVPQVGPVHLSTVGVGVVGLGRRTPPRCPAARRRRAAATVRRRWPGSRRRARSPVCGT